MELEEIFVKVHCICVAAIAINIPSHAWHIARSYERNDHDCINSKSTMHNIILHPDILINYDHIYIILYNSDLINCY